MRLGCTSTSAPLRQTRRGGQCPLLVTALGAAALVSALGCRQDAESPSVPEDSPTLSAAAIPLSFMQVSVGGGHSCGVTTGNRAVQRARPARQRKQDQQLEAGPGGGRASVPPVARG
jgi:hypothetical protein